MNHAASMLILATAVALVACGGDRSDLRQYVARIKARKSDHIRPIPNIRAYRPFAYRPHPGQQPFTPFAGNQDDARHKNASGTTPNFHRNREALERFSLDTLRMVGTLTVDDTRFALVKAPDGVVHRIAPGNHMGRHFGRVTAVVSGAIRLTEIVADGVGGYRKRPATVALTR